MMLKSRITAILLVGFVFFASAQQKDLELYISKYPNVDLVRLVNENIITISMDEGAIKIQQESKEGNLFLNDAALQHSKESVSYSTFYDLKKIEASSFEMVNDTYQETKVTDFKEKDELHGSFYDDLKSVNFRYPNLKKGSKSELKITELIKDPRFLSAFYFGGYYPTVHSKLVIEVDENIDLIFKKFNMENMNVSYSKKEKRKRVIHTWEVENVAKTEFEAATPNYRNYYPHIVPRIKSYRTENNTKIKLLEDVGDLYNWYYSLVQDINKDPLHKELEQLVTDLTKDKNSELEKVRAIYYWVQNNIKYIANEYALGGFVPREANDVFEKKYGDCKDNSSILFEMLRSAGIKGNLTWIGTRSVPYRYEELPTPAVDNHMILSYENNGETYFLDATGRYLSLEYPSSFIQGKEALIGKGVGEYRIFEVPVLSPEKNQEIDSSFVKIENGSLIGNASTTFTGYAKINLFSRLESFSKKETQDFYNARLRKGNNKFFLESFKEVEKYSYDKNFNVIYDFKLSDYIVAHEDEIYVDLNLNKVALGLHLDEKRKTDFEVKNKGVSSFVVKFEIPKGYNVDYLPENLEVDLGYASASVVYTQKGNFVYYKQDLRNDFLLLPKEKMPEYVSMLKKIKKVYKEVVVLKKLK